MADPVSFPVWLDGGADGPVLVLDANGYRAAQAKGYVFTPNNPPISRPTVNNRVVSGAPPSVQIQVSGAQPAHAAPTSIR